MTAQPLSVQEQHRVNLARQRKRAALHQRFLRQRKERGWRLPLPLMTELHEAIEHNLVRRISCGAPICEADRELVLGRVFDSVCGLISKTGGQLPKEIWLVSNGSYYDRFIVLELLALTEERALARAKATLEAVNATFTHLVSGLDALRLQLKEASKQ